MSNISAAAPADTTALRGSLLGDRVTVEQAAAAFGATTRAIYKLIDDKRVPFVKVLGKRYMRPADIREAQLRDRT